jgi:ketosteroid isomerase-like protein
VSQANVEVVRCVVEALNTRDLEGYLACCTEDVELHTPLEVLVGVHGGPGGIRRSFADIEDAAPDFHIDLQRAEAISGNQVLAFRSHNIQGTRERYPDDGGGHDCL